MFSAHAAKALERIPLDGQASPVAGASYTERWLQDLIQSYPEVLPIGEIEPGFGRLIPISKEVTCGHGRIDNLFVTSEGGIALVETKLWRNPEARRAVVTQALDYAAALARMSYLEFEHAALGGEFAGRQVRPSSLYEVVAEQADALDEARFVDAISMNLRRGRMLVIAAGDGIRTESETLAQLLQSHAGARFTFALVAIELFRADDNQILAVPRTIAKTVLIERGVVRIEDGRAVITAPAAGTLMSAPVPTRITMTEDLFLELMGERDPALPASLAEFLAKATDVGVRADWKASLNLKWYGDQSTVNLAYLKKDGSIATDATFYTAKASTAALKYLEGFAALSGGKIVQNNNSVGPYVLAKDGKSSIRIEQLLPHHSQAWVDLMAEFIRETETGAAAEMA